MSEFTRCGLGPMRSAITFQEVNNMLRKSKALSPSQGMKELDNDLLIEILLRLPIKSLARFKCVSKEWMSFISDSSFIAMKARRDPLLGLLHLSLTGGDRELHYFPLKHHHHHNNNTNASFIFPDQENLYRVQATCSDILLCQSRMNGPFFVLNITTNTHTQVPPLPCGVFSVAFGLAFDPNTSPYSSDHHFNIIAYTTRNQFNIYSSETGLWRESRATPLPIPRKRYFPWADDGVFFNGSLYWITDSENMIVFDVDREQARRMSLPVSFVWDGNGIRCDAWFGVVEGKLRLVQYWEGIILMWVLEDHEMGEWRTCHTEIAHGPPKAKVIFFNGELIVFSYCNMFDQSSHVQTYGMREKNWGRSRKLLYWMDHCRKFIPYQVQPRILCTPVPWPGGEA
ncbi:F-box protein [Acorus calamus]|uniref:F-box protein n=1 Tax=Acorus calamus TaxID=4465 RepID=A0AAV9FA70_ACOCL|nr:F-box protein [Acorus calamus]